MANDPRTVTVRWYFVPDGTPFIPFDTVFYSHNWDTDPKGWVDDLGEDVDADREWVNGAPPGNAPGIQVCGTPDAYLNGVASYPTTPTPLGGLGTPLCCFPAAAMGPRWCPAFEASLPAGYSTTFTPVVPPGPGVILTTIDTLIPVAGPCGYGATANSFGRPSGLYFPGVANLDLSTPGVQRLTVTLDFEGLQAGWFRAGPWDGYATLNLAGGGTISGWYTPHVIQLGALAGPGLFCAATSSAEWDLYFLAIPAYLPTARGLHMASGTYPLKASSPCNWTAQVATRGTSGAHNAAIPFFLTIGTGRQISGFCVAISRLGMPVNVQYQGPAFWDGSSPVTLTRSTTARIKGWTFPNQVQVTWPGAA